MKKHKIAIVYDRNQPFTTGIYCKSALEEMGHEITFYDRKSYILKNFDYVMKIDDGEPTPFRCMPWHKTIFWAIDTHTNIERLYNIAKRADWVFCCQKNGVELFEKENIKATWLPLAGHMEKPEKGHLSFDVAFIGGTESKKRKELKEKIDQYPWNLFFGPAKREEISTIYSNSTVGINSLVDNDVNMRTFEVTINGALLVMERIKNNGMELIFKENEEYLVYNDTDELCRILDRVFSNPGKFQHIRDAGHKRAVSEHTYVNRMKKILESIS